MRVLVTGAGGFVGRWLTEGLRNAGHETLADNQRVDVTDGGDVRATVSHTLPDAVAHLAAVSFPPEAAADPVNALEVAVAGTINVLEAVRSMAHPAVVLVTGSSEVYGVHPPEDLPLRESSALRPQKPYALAKAAQESAALAYAARFDLRVVVTRSFSHIGPGQSDNFVVPAMSKRVHELAAGMTDAIRVGNIDVRRDMSDVRDVVEAYRLLLESSINGNFGAGGLVVNVCSGHSVTIRWIVEEMCRLASVEPRLRVDPDLVRPDDAAEMRGDPSLIRKLTGWQARTPLTTTIGDVWASMTAPVAVAAL
jgi:GDP-4-dehydro-6-deoxy-D-mannose reductase